MKKIQILMDGTEKNKNEIVYNNVIEAMDSLDLTKDEQIDYLKGKVTALESDYRSRLIIAVTVIIGLLTLAFGLYLMSIESFTFGIIFSLAAFTFTTLKLIFIIGKTISVKNSKYSEIERLRQLLNNKLK